MGNGRGGYSFIDVAQGRPEQDTAEQAARIQAMQQGVAEGDIKLARMRKEAEPGGVTDKQIQDSGLALDISIQNKNHEKMLADLKNNVLTADAVNKSLASHDQAVGSLWSYIQGGGDKDFALEQINKSHFVFPGQEIKDFKIEDATGPDGKPTKQAVFYPKKEGEAPIVRPVDALNAIAERTGATYEKLKGDETLMRRGRNGVVTPMYSTPKFKDSENVPGGTYNEGTGLPPSAIVTMPSGQPASQPAAAAPRVPMAVQAPALVPGSVIGPGNIAPTEQPVSPAAAGVSAPADVQTSGPAAPMRYGAMMPAAGGQPARVLPYPPSRKDQTAREATQQHEDARVKQLEGSVRYHLTGTDTFSPMKPETQAKFDKIMSIAGPLVRSGKTQESALMTAADRVARDEALQSGAGGNSGAYSGPTPWKQ